MAVLAVDSGAFMGRQNLKRNSTTVVSSISGRHLRRGPMKGVVAGRRLGATYKLSLNGYANAERGLVDISLWRRTNHRTESASAWPSRRDFATEKPPGHATSAHRVLEVGHKLWSMSVRSNKLLLRTASNITASRTTNHAHMRLALLH